MRTSTRMIRRAFLAAVPAILGAWACTGTVITGTTGAGATGAGATSATSATGVKSATSTTGATGGDTSTGGAEGVGGFCGPGGACGAGCAGGAGGSGGTGGCPQGETVCAGACVDLANDVANCGACGEVCTLPNATAACMQGTCSVLECDPGWANCNGHVADGCEADVQSDPMNCGECGMVCIGSQLCCAGSCDIGCPKGFTTCGTPLSCSNVCGTMLGTNQNCDFCGDVCAFANGTAMCVPGPSMNTCMLVECDPGWADCNDLYPPSCYANLTEPANCGACGNVCGPGQTCNQGTCQ
jgi:hypothetical protein